MLTSSLIMLRGLLRDVLIMLRGFTSEGIDDVEGGYLGIY